MRQLRILTVSFATMLTIACGGSSTPTTPTPPPTPQLAGVWSGTFESSNFSQQAISLQLTQAGTSVNGTWVVQAVNWSGTITGTVDASTFSGSITFNAPSAGTATCTGSAALSGPPGSVTMTWSGPGVTGNCSGMPLGLRWVLQRR